MVPNVTIWRLRVSKGFTAAKLAKAAKIDGPKMTLIERHGWIPDRAVQEAIASELGTTTDALFARDQDETELTA